MLGDQTLALMASDVLQRTLFHLWQFDIRDDNDLRPIALRARDFDLGEVNAIDRMRYAGLAQDFVIFHFRCSSPRRKVHGIAPLRLFLSRLSLNRCGAKENVGGGGRSRTYDTADMSRML